MFFVPTWVTNVLFMITVYLSAFQHVRMKRANPVRNIQFAVIAFSLLMILIVANYNHENPWLSLAFFLISVGCLGLMIRQQRMVPPMKQSL